MDEASRGETTSAPPRTLQEAIGGFLAEGRPLHAELIRIVSEKETFARLVDRLPHEIEAGDAALAIVWLKLWGAWHDLYPLDRAAQAMTQYNQARRAAADNADDQDR